MGELREQVNLQIDFPLQTPSFSLWNSAIGVSSWLLWTNLASSFAKKSNCPYAPGGKELVVSERPVGASRQYGLRFQGGRINDGSIRRAMAIADAIGYCHDTVVLERCRLSDVGIGRLCEWRNTRTIFIDDMDVSDAGVGVLTKMPALEHLEIKGIVVLSKHSQ